jgi:hypothetical protein
VPAAGASCTAATGRLSIGVSNCTKPQVRPPASTTGVECEMTHWPVLGER